MIGAVSALEEANAVGDPDSRLSLAIAGLLLLAMVIVVATVAYWRATRPGTTPRRNHPPASDPSLGDDRVAADPDDQIDVEQPPTS